MVFNLHSSVITTILDSQKQLRPAQHYHEIIQKNNPINRKNMICDKQFSNLQLKNLLISLFHFISLQFQMEYFSFFFPKCFRNIEPISRENFNCYLIYFSFMGCLVELISFLSKKKIELDNFILLNLLKNSGMKQLTFFLQMQTEAKPLHTYCKLHK